jgi:hypothetical protein
MSVASKNKWITIVLYHQICTRETASALRVQNGDLIIMGGLINKEEREARTRTPIIGNVPLFGGLTTVVPRHRGRRAPGGGGNLVFRSR